MISSRSPSHEAIQAYIDGLLRGRELATVAAYLHEHPEVASEVEILRRQNQALKQIGEEVLDEPVPERLRAVLRRSGGNGSNGADAKREDEIVATRPQSCWSS